MKKLLFITAVLGMVLSGCKEDEPVTYLFTRQLMVYVGETASISVYPSPKDYTFTPNDERIITVSEKGIVTPKRSGITNVTVKRGSELAGICEVIVPVQYYIYNTSPYLAFGDPVDTIKAHETRQLDIAASSETTLTYVGDVRADDESYIVYTFDGGKLTECMVYFNSSNEYIHNGVRYSMFERLKLFLREIYTVTENGTEITFEDGFTTGRLSTAMRDEIEYCTLTYTAK